MAEDRDGKLLKIGDRVAYAQRAGNGANLRTGVVADLRVEEDRLSWVVIDTDRNARAERLPGEVIVIPSKEVPSGS